MTVGLCCAEEFLSSGTSNQHPKVPGGLGSSCKTIRNGRGFVRSIHRRFKTPRSASEQECGEESRHTGCGTAERCGTAVCKAVHKHRAQNLGSELSSTKLKEFPLSQKPLSEGTQWPRQTSHVNTQLSRSAAARSAWACHGCQTAVQMIHVCTVNKWMICSAWWQNWMRKCRGQGLWGSLGSSSLNCKRCALVDYLQEQVMMLQEISQKTKRYQGGRERVGQWVPIPVVGNRSLLRWGQKFTLQYTRRGRREGGSALTQGVEK